jgi:septal ring factor EnvC (AmiA/AmiB activator)
MMNERAIRHDIRELQKVVSELREYTKSVTRQCGLLQNLINRNTDEFNAGMSSMIEQVEVVRRGSEQDRKQFVVSRMKTGGDRNDTENKINEIKRENQAMKTRMNELEIAVRQLKKAHYEEIHSLKCMIDATKTMLAQHEAKKH